MGCIEVEASQAVAAFKRIIGKKRHTSGQNRRLQEDALLQGEAAGPRRERRHVDALQESALSRC
jgi:hypothetical protein